MHQHIDENGMQELINSLEKLAASNPQEQFSLVDNLVLGNNDFYHLLPSLNCPL